MTNKLRELAIKTFKALDCSGMARVDFLINADTEEIFIGEINTIPGFTQISMYPKLWEITGITFPELITKLIQFAVDKKNDKLKLRTDIEETGAGN
jgi:D-alanine-D-alanine ligase